MNRPCTQLYSLAKVRQSCKLLLQVSLADVQLSLSQLGEVESGGELGP